jgi:hypothetical protein
MKLKKNLDIKEAPITVTESLAKGLKDRFFNEMISESKIARDNFVKKKIISKNRNSFAKLTSSVKSSFKENALIVYEGGSNSKPYLIFDLLTTMEDRPYNSWNEKCLTGTSFLFNYSPSVTLDSFTTYSISEHAIARLYLRTKPVMKNGLVDCKYITRELFYVPIWASFWGAILYANGSSKFFESASPLIPTHSGLFICDFDGENIRPEIRTFVDDIHLSESQVATKNLMLQAAKGLEESPLSFLVLLARSGIDNAELLASIIARRVLTSIAYDSLKNSFFYRIEDDNKRATIKNEFDKVLRAVAEPATQKIDDALKVLGIRRFQTEIKKILVQPD